ncbi:MAG TPA: HAD-IA family hydrolase [Aliidongia sp.]|nr:HAD-IA family hydrolase [Aliidongia sp.]
MLFDMDDVLCAYSRPTRCAYLAKLAGSTPEAVYAAIWETGFEAQADAGILDAGDYLRGYGERLGYPLTLSEWLDARKASTTPKHEVLDLVRRVRERARVAVLTNNTTLVADHIERLFPELRPLFGDAIYASAAFRAVKPSLECFDRCLGALGVAPRDVLFVDDLAGNVAGARRAGLSAHHYISPQGLADVLRHHELL